MENQLFRQKSIDRISSPEQLHDYMRVTSPKLWMILSAIIVLMVGLIVLASTANMENTMKVQIKIHHNEDADGKKEEAMYALVEQPLEQKDTLEIGQEVRTAGRKGKIDYLFEDTDKITASVVFTDDADDLPDGLYDGEIVFERRTPISFLLN